MFLVVGIVLAFVLFVLFVLVVLWLLDKKLHVPIVRAILMKRRWEGPYPYYQLKGDPLPIATCVDLGAFRKPLQDLRGIDTVVIMEDRQPNSFLGYTGYEPGASVFCLNKHGPNRAYSTQESLRELVEGLHKQGKKVIIGFWLFWGIESNFVPATRRPTKWLLKHPELRRRPDEADIGNPFARLQKENMSFASHIARQYEKLQRDFGFDGLMLGDGGCGFRTFFNPANHRDKEGTGKQWAGFYRTIAEVVHNLGGELWAYDCMGFSYQEAKLHGADYRLLAEAGLDVLVFQTYPTAWGYYMRVPGKTGLRQDKENLLSVKNALQDTNTRLFYSLEMGDEVEGWLPDWADTSAQMDAFSNGADGKFLVWGNGLISSFERI